jgi:hypothetical protein
MKTLRSLNHPHYSIHSGVIKMNIGKRNFVKGVLATVVGTILPQKLFAVTLILRL